ALPIASAPRAPASAGGLPLPIALTPLIGRTAELAHASTRLLRDKVRLLTITGPAGVGKSRLALELAWTCHDAFADGAFFVDVATQRSPEQLSAAVAQIFGFQARTGARPCADVVAHLRDKHMLVVLDNFERLLSAASMLAEVLAACPHIAVVVTSR